MSGPEQVLQVRTTPMVRHYLEVLTATGVYGASVEQTAEELIRERLREILPGKPGNTPPPPRGAFEGEP